LSGSINPFIDNWLKPLTKKVEKDVEQDFEKEYYMNVHENDLSELKFEAFFHEFMTSDDGGKIIISEMIKLFIETMQDSPTPIPEDLFAYDAEIKTLSTSRIFGDELLTF
jgi:hypothetical protein